MIPKVPSISPRQDGLRPICCIIAASTLIAAYGLGGLWLPGALILLLGALWILGQRADWRWLSWLMMILFAITAAVGILLDLTPVLLVVGLIAALSAWDLDEFAHQLRCVDVVEQEQALRRRHLRRLLAADGFGLLFAILALSIQVNLSFGLGVVLGLLALIGLSRAIGFLRRQSD
jgi:hypothetical protein